MLSFGDSVAGDFVITSNSFVFALLCTAVVYAMTRIQQVTPETIVLLGVAMMFLFTALTSLLQYLGDPLQMAELTYWMFGSLNKTTWTKLGIVALPCLIGLVLAYRWSWDLNTMIADDQTATSSGVNVARVRLKGLVLAALLTATVVSVVGPIGFIGLVAPHLARMLVGGDHRFLFPVSWLLGATVLLLADTIARTVVAPVVIPVGILTTFINPPSRRPSWRHEKPVDVREAIDSAIEQRGRHRSVLSRVSDRNTPLRGYGASETDAAANMQAQGAADHLRHRSRRVAPRHIALRRFRPSPPRSMLEGWADHRHASPRGERRRLPASRTRTQGMSHPRQRRVSR